ncbi:response regulator [Roseisolibacter sp. H3M3-2]|uniref:response regulator n=1 Tax=Roseisolibacter sp. H3M3-2 TaxID=3031323 RepID=UPI0023DBF17B|nr:response regulator [Roseisolibacter sp. H3M3-2]MDF1502215.1 response regulator [Roseisolibacter sp. H3M3-2]
MKPLELLLVEDNPGDVELTREALREAALPCRLAVATDGAEALRVLRREGAHADAPRPGLVLLDLNLPKLDGRAVLAAVKGDPALRDVPVVVLTTSRAAADVREAYALHANAYVVKPADLDAHFAAVRALVEFWGGVVVRPADV